MVKCRTVCVIACDADLLVMSGAFLCGAHLLCCSGRWYWSSTLSASISMSGIMYGVNHLHKAWQGWQCMTKPLLQVTSL